MRPAHFDVDPLTWFPSDRFSFPSGHALNAFAIGSVIALAFPLLAVPVLLLAVSVAASRVVLGLHWLSDVLVGSLADGLIGLSVWLTFLQSKCSKRGGAGVGMRLPSPGRRVSFPRARRSPPPPRSVAPRR
ncbi:MAG: phosphatase PAP2 family protein [Acidobacteria bacterium]|nr:phosphatase PAP2 family protein [Acidobacteriota bacterium]